MKYLHPIITVILPVFFAGGCFTTLDTLELSARQGNASSQAKLGRSYLVGGTTKINYQLAHSLLRQAASGGNDEGRYSLGVMQERGLESLLPNRPAAERFYAGSLPAFQRRAREKDDVQALFFLGEMCRFGRGVPQDRARAKAIFEDCVRRDHSESILALGVMLYDGEGVEHDETRGRQLLTRAALRHYPEAQYRLGLDCRKRNQNAIGDQWLKLASDNGYPPAMYLRAMESAHGPSSEALLRRAADSGIADACYEMSRRVSGPAEQELFLLDAAIRDNVNAMFELARRRRDGAKRQTSRVMAILYFAHLKSPGNSAILHELRQFDRETGLLLPVKYTWYGRGSSGENLLLTTSEMPRCIEEYKSGAGDGGRKLFNAEIAENPTPFYLNNDWHTIHEHGLPLSWAGEIFRRHMGQGAREPGFWLSYSIIAGLAGRGATQHYAATRLAECAERITDKTDQRQALDLARLLRGNATILLDHADEAYAELAATGKLGDTNDPAMIHFINFWCRALCKDKAKLAAAIGVDAGKLGNFALPIKQEIYDLYLEHVASDRPIVDEPELK